MRSAGSYRRKARIPVSGFTERAFLANERKMIEDAEIIVKEDFESVVKAEVVASILTDNEKERPPSERLSYNASQSGQKTSGGVGQQRKSCDVKRRQTPTSEERESISSISSFSSSFVIDRIFHWRKSSSKACKDSISISGLEELTDTTDETASAVDNDKQIDSLAARSLSVYNSVSADCSSTAEKKLPLKPLKFHIKQLESILSGSLSPPHQGDQMEVQLKLDSLRVMQSLEMMNKSKEYQSQIIYDFPRYLY